MPVPDKDILRMRETIELLAAQRGDAQRPLSAVRRQELRAIGAYRMRSGQVTSTPTAAQFNDLQADVAHLFATLQRISNVLGNATISEA